MNPTQDSESRDRLIRLEEAMKHIERTMADGFKRIEVAMATDNTRQSEHAAWDTSQHEMIATRVEALEKKVVWVSGIWAAVTFISTVGWTMFTFLAKH